MCEKTETVSTLDCATLAIAEYEKEHGKFVLVEGESFIAMLRNCALVFTMENGEVKVTVVGGKPYTLNVFCDIFRRKSVRRLRGQEFSRISKRGSPELRRTLFLVMDCLLKNRPLDNPVYQFMDRKRAEGRPYLVYMTAGANRFLRICYGKVEEYLAPLEQLPATDTDQNT